jgi:hypothetical protein
MAETKPAAKKEAAPAAAAGGEKKAHNPRVKKKEVFWTLERCMKTARRFHSLEEWAAGTPSCYKAAVARGYVAQCTSHMTTKTTKVVKPVTKVADKKKPAPAAAKFKKTA